MIPAAASGYPNWCLRFFQRGLLTVYLHQLEILIVAPATDRPPLELPHFIRYLVDVREHKVLALQFL